jgi:hypothetical protein
MIAWAPLAAADIDYIKLIGVVVAISIWAINHLLAGLKKSRAQAPPPNATPPHDPAAASMRKDLNAEVKEFLRRAAQQRGTQPASRPQASIPPGGNRRDDDQRRQDQRKQKRKSQSSKPVAPVAPKLDDSLAHRRVTSRLENSSLDERTEQLSNLDRSSQIDARTQQSLDHPIGQLTSGLLADPSNSTAAAETSDSQADYAADIAAALRSPRSIRTAMILNEILARPTDRW